jgi:Fe2+ transport system protein FeoA
MDCISGESVYLKNHHVKVEARLTQVSLKDVPLAVRRKEAKKVLFLTRYE